MFYRRDRPGIPVFTALLVILWLLLAGYILLHPDPVGVIILVVMAVFIAGPALFVAIGTRRARREQANVGTPTDASDMPYSDISHNGHSRRDVADRCGVQQRATGEFPDEGGDNP